MRLEGIHGRSTDYRNFRCDKRRGARHRVVQEILPKELSLGIPTELSKAESYIQSKGLTYKKSGEQLVLDCFYCGKEGHFYLSTSGNKDGLFMCQLCGESGNLFKLSQFLGDSISGVVSMQAYAAAGQAPGELPDVDSAHARLLNDAEALDYLAAERGYTLAAIQEFKLGLGAPQGFSGRWLVIPYYTHGTLTYAKFRTLPPAAKDFKNVSGRENPLYNSDVIEKDMEELTLVEGEGDALALLSAGYRTVCGIPGANMKKASWIDRLDQAAPHKLYLLYDNDRVGQKAAREMAIRIGIEKAHNILLPPFTKYDGTEGKDINDWLRAGHTMEEFEILKRQARPFDVEGVTGLAEAIYDLENDIVNNNATKPTLDTPWPSLNARLGGFEWGDLVCVIAQAKVGKTTWVLNLLDYYASVYKFPVFLYCLEMLPKRLARKWVSYATQTDDTPGASKFCAQTFEAAKNVLRQREADLLFGYTRHKKQDDVFETIRQVVRRYGVRVVAFDNLQILSRSVEHAAQEISILSKKFKEIAMELNILMVLIVQPNRVREGEIVAASNTMGSSAVEKDTDCMIAFHRNRTAKIKADQFNGFLEAEENFEPQLLTRVDLSRYAPGGVTTLWMEGSTSSVREFSEQERASSAPTTPLMNNELPIEA